MEIILSNLCDSLTGTLNKNHGYSIRQSKDGRFYGKRHSKGHVPPDGHLRFILDCAQMAQNSLFISDIRVSPQELDDALREAGLAPSLRDSDLPSSGASDDSSKFFSDSDLPSSGARHDSAEFLSASDILLLKERINQ